MKIKVKFIIFLFCIIGFNLIISVYAGYQEHYTLAQQHFFNARYSSAIDEFRKALLVNPYDNSARIGLINSYVARGSYKANYDHNYREAADDFKSAIFYLKYYVDKDIVANSFSSISSTENSLHFCEKQYGASSSAEAHYKLAEELNAVGNFSASMYEYEQIVNNEKYRKTALLRIAFMMKSINNLIKSAEYYKEAVNYDSNDFSLRMSYADILDKMGKTAESLKQYEFILCNCNSNDTILYDLERIFQKNLKNEQKNINKTTFLKRIKQKQQNIVNNEQQIEPQSEQQIKYRNENNTNLFIQDKPNPPIYTLPGI